MPITEQVQVAPTMTYRDSVLKTLTHIHYTHLGPPLAKCDIHLIDKTKSPISVWNKQYNKSRATALPTMLGKLLKQGFVKEATSKKNSPLILILKTAGEFRLIVDLTKINEVIRKDCYPNSFLLFFFA